MRKLITSLLSVTCLTFALSATPAKAGCITLNEQSPSGSITGQICLTSTSVQLNEVTIFNARTGKTYTLNGSGTISGTWGHYTVSGSVTISDGTNTETVNVTSSGSNLMVAATGFINKTVTLMLELGS